MILEIIPTNEVTISVNSGIKKTIKKFNLLSSTPLEETKQCRKLKKNTRGARQIFQRHFSPKIDSENDLVDGKLAAK